MDADAELVSNRHLKDLVFIKNSISGLLDEYPETSERYLCLKQIRKDLIHAYSCMYAFKELPSD